MKLLEGRKAVVTGGSRGIGAASALALAEAGCDVLLTYRQSKDAAQTVSERIHALGRQAFLVHLEATQPDSVKALGDKVRQTLGQVDVLFNNAGDMIRRASLEETTAEMVRQTMDLNVLSTILVTQAMLPLFAQPAVIVNMSSLAARMGGGPGSGVYAAAKGAVLTLTKNWAVELAPRGIRVFAVAPGIIQTDFHTRHTSAEVLRKMTATLPVGKVGVPEDVARAVVYLAGESGGFMTGACIDINGGFFVG